MIYVFRCPECKTIVEQESREAPDCHENHSTVLGAQRMQRAYNLEAANLVPPKT